MHALFPASSRYRPSAHGAQYPPAELAPTLLELVPAGQSLQPVSLEALGVLLTNAPASQALCAVQEVAVVVAPARHCPAAQLEQPVSLEEVGAVLTRLNDIHHLAELKHDG